MSQVTETYDPKTLWDLIKETRFGMLTAPPW